MKKFLVMVLSLCMFGSYVSAATVQGIDLDFVTIGNAGNDADSTGYGAVDYEYQIGKYEITNGQWDQFVSLAGAPTGNPSYAYDASAYFTGTNVPTNAVSWYEAAQFCNYLTSGDKYSGAYGFDASGNFTGVDRASAISAYGTAYVIPTENEWYKAAYYKPDGSGYSLYANGQNTIPAADNGWNYYGGAYSSPWNVGTGTEEQNGTYDMMGNVWEWNETEIYGSDRGIRGGSYDIVGYLSSSYRGGNAPFSEFSELGFRVASVPEPCTLALVSMGGLVLARRKR